MAGMQHSQADTGLGSGHLLRETLGHVCYAGAKGRLTMHANSVSNTRFVVRVRRRIRVRFSMTLRLSRKLSPQTFLDYHPFGGFGLIIASG